VWLAAADLLVFAAGRGGGVDELSRACPAPRARRGACRVLPRANPHALAPSAARAVAALCRALLAALRLATAKGTFSAAGVLTAFPRVCVLFEEIVSEGVVEATDVDTLQAGVRLKTAASAAT